MSEKLSIDMGHLDEKSNERIKDWVTFWRNNPQVFAEMLGIKLYPYQKIWLYMMAKSTKHMTLSSRGTAKSWISAVLACVRAILYPGSEITIASKTKKQSSLIIAKIEKLREEHPLLAREIVGSVTVNENKAKATFVNGSVVQNVAGSENSRGERSTMLILDEFPLLSTDVIKDVLRPMKYSRRPGYSSLSKYSHMTEEPVEVSISSVRFKGEPYWEEAVALWNSIASGDKGVSFFATDILTSIKHGIKTLEQVRNDKNASSSDPISFQHESLNVPTGGAKNAYYKMDFFKRDLKRLWRPWIPIFGKLKSNPYSYHRSSDDEIRILSADIATAAESDASAVTLARLFPTKQGYRREIVWMETFVGENIIPQAIKIKRLWHEFSDGYNHPNSYICLDMRNSGIGIFDLLSQVTIDDDWDMEYPAYTVSEHPSIPDKTVDKLRDRTISKDALPIIYPIYATSELNSKIAVSFRNALKTNLLRFPVGESSLEDHLLETKNEHILMNDSAVRTHMLLPSIQTSLLVHESISLEMQLTGAGDNIKLSEPSTGRKDRFSSCSYLNYLASILDNDLLKETEETDDLSEWINGFAFA